MPRKTKKQKLRADKRRFESTNSQVVPERLVKGEFSFNVREFSGKTFEAKMAKRSDKSTTFSNEMFHLPDLVRSILLALFILVLELVLYWARA